MSNKMFAFEQSLAKKVAYARDRFPLVQSCRVSVDLDNETTVKFANHRHDRDAPGRIVYAEMKLVAEYEFNGRASIKLTTFPRYETGPGTFMELDLNEIEILGKYVKLAVYDLMDVMTKEQYQLEKLPYVMV